MRIGIRHSVSRTKMTHSVTPATIRSDHSLRPLSVLFMVIRLLPIASRVKKKQKVMDFSTSLSYFIRRNFNGRWERKKRSLCWKKQRVTGFAAVVGAWHLFLISTYGVDKNRATADQIWLEYYKTLAREFLTDESIRLPHSAPSESKRALFFGMAVTKRDSLDLKLICESNFATKTHMR